MTITATPSKWFYAAEFPYGLHALNRDGRRANVLHRFATKAERDAWIARDPEHRERRSSGEKQMRTLLRGDQWEGDELRYMD